MSSKSYNGPEKDTLEPIATRGAGELAEKGHVDVAAKFLASIDPSVKDTPVTASEARKVLRKIDFIILPIIAGTVILSAVDKIIISNASILGMSHDLDLVGNQFSWVGSIFYFGFLIFEFPTAVLIQKLPVAKLLAGLVFCWAVLMCSTAATQNFAGLAIVRFIMGCMEAGVFPIASIITVMWYTNKEQPIRVAFWYNQFSSIGSGLVSYGIGHTHTSLAQWHLLFIVLGAFSLFWSITILVFLPDSPTTCWYLTERERYICVKRISNNNTGVEDKGLKWYQVKECVLDPRTWLLATFACAQNIPNGGLVTFSAIIVKGLGYSTLTTMLLGVPTGVIATVWQLVLAGPVAKLKNKRCTIIALANIIPVTCAILMWKLPRDNTTGLLGGYYAFYTYWGPYVLSTSVPMANVSGHTKKVTVNAIYFLAYCTGNIIGPQVFRESDAPDYTHGYIGLLACFIVSSTSISLYGFLCYRENAKRDQNGPEFASEHPSDAYDELFSDRTDKEKLGFRYMY